MKKHTADAYYLRLISAFPWFRVYTTYLIEEVGWKVKYGVFVLGCVVLVLLYPSFKLFAQEIFRTRCGFDVVTYSTHCAESFVGCRVHHTMTTSCILSEMLLPASIPAVYFTLGSLLSLWFGSVISKKRKTSASRK
jgi:hypothetical protein